MKRIFSWAPWEPLGAPEPTLVHYIYYKNEIGKSCEINLPLLKNDVTRILRPLIFTFP